MGNYNIEYYMSHVLNDDSIITHKCSGCGKCCNRNIVGDFAVTGADLFALAKHLGVDVYEVADRYCNGHVGDNSGVLVFCLKSDDTGNCVFLNNGKCAVHEAKPAVCAVFPFGRMATNPLVDGPVETQYFEQPSVPCVNSRETKISFKEWKEKFNLEESERNNSAWNALLATGIQIEREIPFEKGSWEYIVIMDMLAEFLYDFDIERDYIGQVNERLDPFKGKQGKDLLDAFVEFHLLRATAHL